MKKWSLNKKIWGVLGLLAFAFVCSTIFSISKITEVRNSLVEITSQDVVKDQITSRMAINQRIILIRLLDSIIYTDAQKVKESIDRIEDVILAQEKEMQHYEEFVSNDEKEIWKGYSTAYAAFLKNIEDSKKSIINNHKDIAVQAYSEGEAHLVVMRKGINDLNKITEGKLKAKVSQANINSKNAITVGMIVSGVSILLTMLIAFFVLKNLNASIRVVVSSLNESSNQVNSVSNQISSSSHELSQAATEQAASLEETVASLEELSAMVQVNSENARQAAELSSDSSQIATKGAEEMKNLLLAINAISDSSKKIENITNVIDDIAFQTNLLALNASVEAARVGEHGKGFAVVADAVRALAHRSAVAAKEISQLIGDSVEKIEKGAEHSAKSEVLLTKIVESTRKVSDIVVEISSASGEQAAGIEQISQAMNQLDQASQSNASSSQQLSGTSQDISSLSENLVVVVNDLKRIVYAQDASTASTSEVSRSVIPFNSKKSNLVA